MRRLKFCLSVLLDVDYLFDKAYAETILITVDPCYAWLLPAHQNRAPKKIELPKFPVILENSGVFYPSSGWSANICKKKGISPSLKIFQLFCIALKQNSFDQSASSQV